MHTREDGHALGILLALVAIIAVVEGILLIQMETRVSEIEEQQAMSLPSSQSPLALADEVRALEQKVEDQASTIESLSVMARKNADQVRTVARSAGEPSSRPLPVAAGGASASLSKGDLEKVVAEAVDSRLEEMPRSEGGEWKPTLDEFQKVLGLSEDQIGKAEEAFDSAKHEAYRLLTIPRDDGTNVMDDLVAAMRDETDPEAAMKKVFVQLFTEKIPGRDEPYIVEMMRIKESTQGVLNTFLTAEQQTKLGRLNLDHLGVHTSYDPFAEYLQDSLR